MGKISMGKHYTFNGQPVTLLTVDKPGHFPVVAYDSNGVLLVFDSKGSSWSSAELPLVEVKPVFWKNVYPRSVSGNFLSKEEADERAGQHRIACVRFKKGEYI